MIQKLGKIVLPVVAVLAVAAAVCQAQAVMTHHVRQATQDGSARSVGRLPATQTMSLVLTLPLRNQDELDQFLQDVYDPSSPSYRQFLTVEEFTAKFGPTQEDYDAVINFARENGLTVVGTSPNRLNVQVSGPVASVERALQCDHGRLSAPHRIAHVLRAGPGAHSEPGGFSLAHFGTGQLFDSASRRPGQKACKFRREVQRNDRLRAFGLVPGQRHERGLLRRNDTDRQRPVAGLAGVLRHRSGGFDHVLHQRQADE